MECKQKENLKNCKCTYQCEDKGICCECIKHHREHEELPACYFDKITEKTYDRSIKSYLKMKESR